MRILLVEDEVHKRDEMIRCISDVYGQLPDIVDSVSSAVLKVIEIEYDLIVLDMALSTFGENADDQKKGHDQAQGGIEVLRTLKHIGRAGRILIVTQYDDFYVGGVKVKLRDSARVLKDKYGQDIIGAVLYNYKSKSTLQKIMSILRRCK